MNAKRPDKPAIDNGTMTSKRSDAATPRPWTVLVADDDPDMRLYIRRCLRARPKVSMVILEAVDGEDALARVRQGDIDLLITDVVMPRMDGFALCRAVHQDDALGHVSILFVTGELSAREVKERASARRSVEVMAKPFNADQLCEKVTEILGRAQHLS